MNDLASSLRLTLGYTLVDITKTDEVSGHVDSMTRNQQRNWETLVQVLGLRAQLITLSDPEAVEVDVTKMQFGPDFTGKQRVWVFKFGVEHEGVYDSVGQNYGALAGDLINVPIILGLTETANIRLPTFTVSGLQRNIYFEQFKIS
jgi:hypothetical protein